MVKRIGASELGQCLSVIRHGFATVAEEFGLTEQNAPTNGAFMKMDRLQKDFANGDLMFGYVLDGKIVGFVQLAKKSASVFTLEKLAVLPEHRHNGYGERLIESAKSAVQSLGGNKIMIGIIEENIRLKEWYAAHGFVHTGTKKFDHLPFTVGFMESRV